MLEVEMDLEKSLDNVPLLKEVFASIAHQWRGPLSQINSIIGSIDNRLYELNIDDPFITQNLLQVEAITKEMSQSIDDYRGCIGGVKIKSSLQELLVTTIKSVAAGLESNGIALEQALEKSAEFHGDEQLLKQVVITLIDNAKDALVSRNVYKPLIKIMSEADEDSLFIKICDNAGGISKSVRSKIFEADFTTKHNSEGTGLGLFMAKKLLSQKMDAKLSVENKESGACFTIEIPRNENE